MKCPLCGKEFEFSREVCANCPLHSGGCDLVKCPNCGYEFPKGSKIIDFFEKYIRKPLDSWLRHLLGARRKKK